MILELLSVSAYYLPNYLLSWAADREVVCWVSRCAPFFVGYRLKKRRDRLSGYHSGWSRACFIVLARLVKVG